MVALSTRARNMLHSQMLYSLNKIILSSTYAKMDSYDSISRCAHLVSIETLYPTRSSGIEIGSIHILAQIHMYSL